MLERFLWIQLIVLLVQSHLIIFSFFVLLTNLSSFKDLLNKHMILSAINLSLVQSLSRVLLSATPWTAARQASLSITNSRSLPKLMSIELVTPSNHLILCHPCLLLPSIFSSIMVFSNESVLHIRWPKYWSFYLPQNIEGRKEKISFQIPSSFPPSLPSFVISIF